ncbi:MAG: hypothetical protein AAFX51_14325 [Cyanobacteria bacterium J06636_28]
MEKGTVFTLAIASFLSIFISIGDLFFHFSSIPYLKETPQITLLVVGILCLVSWVERVTFFRDLSNQISQLKKSVATALPAQYFTSSYAALNSIEESIQDANRVVRVVFYSTLLDKAFEPRWRQYTGTLQQVMRNRDDLEYKVVFGCKDSEPNVNDMNWLSNRIHDLKATGLKNRIQYHYKQIPLGLFLYSVDTEYLLIGFSNTGEYLFPKNLIKITGNSHFISNINRWYEKKIWEDSKECNFPPPRRKRMWRK